jgi:hypothetical protein
MAAPYRVGDRCRLLFSDGDETVTATLPVERVVALNCRCCWRLEMTRPRSRTGVHVVVDRHGRDRHNGQLVRA